MPSGKWISGLLLMRRILSWVNYPKLSGNPLSPSSPNHNDVYSLRLSQSLDPAALITFSFSYSSFFIFWTNGSITLFICLTSCWTNYILLFCCYFYFSCFLASSCRLSSFYCFSFATFFCNF